MSKVVIVPTGTANRASVMAALIRAGATPLLAREPTELRRAAAIVLPGVGSFGAAMEKLESERFVEPLREAIRSGTPTLAICLGMQLLFDSSEESAGVPGLSVVPGQCERFPSTIRAPHVGWNSIEPAGAAQLLLPGDAYFTHSYRVRVPPLTTAHATTTYGTPFLSAIERGRLLACQFHPELSGPWGIALIGRWLTQEGGLC